MPAHTKSEQRSLAALRPVFFRYRTTRPLAGICLQIRERFRVPGVLRSKTRQSRLAALNRAGVTLMELLLALGVLILLASLAAPSMHRIWQRYRVKAAGDQIRAAFAHAHSEAMRTGQIQVCRLELGGNRFYIQPWMAGDEMINASAEEAYEQSQPQYQIEPVAEQRLPDDVTFEAAEAEFDTRASEIEAEAALQQTAIQQWSQPILFYPDGTSSQAEVLVVNDRREAVRVKLRKLTGLTTVSDVTSLDSLETEETD